jgi:hypothetical protein
VFSRVVTGDDVEPKGSSHDIIASPQDMLLWSKKFAILS